MRGYPKRLPGTSRPGTALGHVVARCTMFGHFWSPFGTLGAKVANPDAPLASPWTPFLSRLCPLLLSVLQGRRCGWHRCSAEGPRGVKMLVLHAKYRCFAKVRVWSPRCQKGLPRGAPGRVFAHLLTTFWNTLASLSPPAATLRPHFDTPVAPRAFLLHFGSIRHPS